MRNYLIWIACIQLSLSAQLPDSLMRAPATPRPAVEARFGITSGLVPVIVTTADLRQLADHPSLNGDYADFDQVPYAAWYNDQLFFAFTYYHPAAFAKHFSYSVGGFFRELQYTSTILQRDTFYQVDVLRGNSLGHELIQYYTSWEQHSFMVTSAQIILPIALNWSTDPSRLLSVQVAFALAPGILVGNAIRHEYSGRSEYLYALPDRPPERYWNGLTKTIAYGGPETTTVRLKGTGFAGYGSLPVALYMRLSRRDSFYGRLQVMAGAEAAYSFYKYRSLPPLSGARVRFSLGLRCRL